MPVSVDVQEELLRELLGADEIRLHGLGGGTRTFRIAATGRLITVGLDWPAERRPEADLDREALLLRRVAERVTVPVPEVVASNAAAGVLIVRELPGRRLIDVAGRAGPLTDAAASVMARTLGELHTRAPAACTDFAPLDTTPPSAWKEETAELAGVVAEALDTGRRADVRAFLARPAPAPTTRHRFTHNDLGIEHVLVDPQRRRVTGIIDWSDAAITDPAVDFGRLLRDLGPAALDRAMTIYARYGGDPASVAPRVGFYAACGLIEDLAFGLLHSRAEYVNKSLATWDSIRTGIGLR